MNDTLIAQYEQHLLGNKKMMIFGTGKERQDQILEIIRYAVTNVLKWDPQDAVDCMNENYINLLKLNTYINELELPADVRPTDYDYIIFMAFPDKVKFNTDKQLFRIYERICEGTQSKFPKFYFSGEKGTDKLLLLLNYVINRKISVNSIDALYEKFSHTSTMHKMFRKWDIYIAYRMKYNSPLEYLHDALPDSRKDDFLFHYYEFMNIFNK